MPFISSPSIGPSMMNYRAPPPSSLSALGVRRSDTPCPIYVSLARPVHDSPRTLTCMSRAPLRASRADHSMSCPSRPPIAHRHRRPHGPNPFLSAAPRPMPIASEADVSSRNKPPQQPAVSSVAASRVRRCVAVQTLKSLFRPGQLSARPYLPTELYSHPLTGLSYRPCRAYPSGFVPGQLRLWCVGECTKLRTTLELGPRLERVRCFAAMVSGGCVLAQPIRGHVRMPPHEVKRPVLRVHRARPIGCRKGIVRSDCSKAGTTSAFTILLNRDHQSRHVRLDSADADGRSGSEIRASYVNNIRYVRGHRERMAYDGTPS
ncbi:hypothetical protein BV20DRAFT_675354 [Pilatotrama ljubarskyi]|nr:hypothetical protein BV20DRAFT_675354 [Pilatotrama ljubarskyi]